VREKADERGSACRVVREVGALGVCGGVAAATAAHLICGKAEGMGNGVGRWGGGSAVWCGGGGRPGRGGGMLGSAKGRQWGGER